jgi:hypothetical protein
MDEVVERPFFQSRLRQEMARSRRFGRPFVLVILEAQRGNSTTLPGADGRRLPGLAVAAARSGARRMRATARRQEARRLRAQGWTYPQIGAHVGVTYQRAQQLVKDSQQATTEFVWVRLPHGTHEGLRREYQRACRRRGEAETDRGFRAWLSRRAARALEAGQ